MLLTLGSLLPRLTHLWSEESEKESSHLSSGKQRRFWEEGHVLGTLVSYFSSAERLHCRLSCLLPPRPLSGVTCWAGEGLAEERCPGEGRAEASRKADSMWWNGWVQVQERELGRQYSECECLAPVMSKSHPDAFLAQLWRQMSDIGGSYFRYITGILKMQSYQKPLVHLLYCISSCVTHCGCY